MVEISPGLWHWSAIHERIGTRVGSHYLLSERVLIDPMIPAEGFDWFREHGEPEQDISSGRRGGQPSGTSRPKGRTRDQLYNDARKLGIEGRSGMNKAQLERAVERARA